MRTDPGQGCETSRAQCSATGHRTDAAEWSGGALGGTFGFRPPQSRRVVRQQPQTRLDRHVREAAACAARAVVDSVPVFALMSARPPARRSPPARPPAEASPPAEARRSSSAVAPRGRCCRSCQWRCGAVAAARAVPRAAGRAARVEPAAGRCALRCAVLCHDGAVQRCAVLCCAMMALCSAALRCGREREAAQGGTAL
jgi:hypothetical protein